MRIETPTTGHMQHGSHLYPKTPWQPSLVRPQRCSLTRGRTHGTPRRWRSQGRHCSRHPSDRSSCGDRGCTETADSTAERRMWRPQGCTAQRWPRDRRHPVWRLGTWTQPDNCTRCHQSAPPHHTPRTSPEGRRARATQGHLGTVLPITQSNSVSGQSHRNATHVYLCYG